MVSLTGRECEEGWGGSDAPGEKGEGGQGRVLDIGGSMVDALDGRRPRRWWYRLVVISMYIIIE